MAAAGNRIAVAVLIFVFGLGLLGQSAAQWNGPDRGDLPDNRQTSRLMSAHEQLVGGNFGEARDRYRDIAAAFRGSVAESVARNGRVVAEILMTFESLAEAEADPELYDIELFRVGTRIDEVETLLEEGAMSPLEAQYWLWRLGEFLPNRDGGDPPAISTVEEFVAAVIAAETAVE